MVDVLDFNFPDHDMPAPGETVEFDLGDGLWATIENTKAPEEEPDAGPLVTHTAVETVAWATVTHAAAVHRRAKRTCVERFTLCSRNGSRQVKQRKRDQPLTAVTCTQWRARLEAEGVL